ncbi:hypothetical protein BKA70DRAFT_749234 [Coprinopsis sp. MPI-PUGE-AT-0042]|nr:hypothetical protein BKA70DRAFT_749234 [Coprinopsis sp. MPI-PUGE-AT-0042]
MAGLQAFAGFIWVVLALFWPISESHSHPNFCCVDAIGLQPNRHPFPSTTTWPQKRTPLLTYPRSHRKVASQRGFSSARGLRDLPRPPGYQSVRILQRRPSETFLTPQPVRGSLISLISWSPMWPAILRSWPALGRLLISSLLVPTPHLCRRSRQQISTYTTHARVSASMRILEIDCFNHQRDAVSSRAGRRQFKLSVRVDEMMTILCQNAK